MSPIVRFVDNILERAVEAHASDVHFEIFERDMLVRLRIDGVLREYPSPERGLGDAIISRVKTLANLDSAEKRLPQDGHIEREYAGRLVDFRVSTLPTQYGESVVLRVLDQGSWHFNIDKVGMPAPVLAAVKECLNGGSGILLTTGPTGSGKTTTLYSALQYINQEGIKILTVEDPVEYEMDGMIQVNVHDEVGLSFDRALRAFLRHDPDKILVGELRDTETARVAIQAALTGHLVLGTLHTNDAPSTVMRLVDMGIEPYLIADTVKGILAQRLVRRICEPCKEACEATAEELRFFPEFKGQTVYRGRGCEACSRTGYAGRFALYEWMPVSLAIREAIRTHSSRTQIQHLAMQEGYVPLQREGLHHIQNGETTVSEILRIQ
ncbi:MAG: GspE/PulE family protein [Puniceicoccales bacterium]|jgi:type II secretory ATPase GspE/PulE/Tfp pilus assembly ATPase PilB-like protein|nr:GspE/PulE family protein [Puniceicoccales bacterium]